MAQLRDLHATAEPDFRDHGDQVAETEKVIEKKGKKDPLFGLFDDLPEPKIEPKEKKTFRPESGDDVDQLLNLKDCEIYALDLVKYEISIDRA